jgi:hypothetical protein
MGCSISIPKENCSFRFSLGNTGIFHLCEPCGTELLDPELFNQIKTQPEVTIPQIKINPQIEEVKEEGND